MTLIQDLRYATRVLRANPGFTLVAVLTLALGIGAAASVFSVVHGAMLRPLAWEKADRLVEVLSADSESPDQGLPMSAPDYREMKERGVSFDGMVATYRSNVSLTGGQGAERLQATWVSPGFFPLLRIEPPVGRAFLAEEDRPGNDLVAVVSHGLFQRRFGGDPGLLGQSVQLDGDSYLVVGVAPPGFSFPRESDLWLPLAFGPEEDDRGWGHLVVYGRLAAGIGVREGRADLTRIAASLAAEYPETNEGKGVKVERLDRSLSAKVRPALLVLLGAVGLLFLIAQVNVTGLLLSRVAARGRDTAVRRALGASRGRLVQHFLAESLVLAVLGCAAGLVLSVWGARLLAVLFAGQLPATAEVELDLVVVVVTVGLSLAGGLAVGLVAALRSSELEIADLLREAGISTTSRSAAFRRVLVVAEVALALVLMTGATLLMRTFVNLLEVDPGFSTENVLTLEVALGSERYAGEPARAAFLGEALDRVASIPGVESVGSVYPLPLFGRRITVAPLVEGTADPGPALRERAELRFASHGYAETLDLELKAGRFLSAGDRAEAPPVAVVNTAFVERFIPDRDPLGLRLTISRDPVSESAEWLTVVGVVGEVRHLELGAQGGPEIYFSALQSPFPWVTLALRAQGRPEDLAGTVRAAIHDLDPELPIFHLQTLDEVVAESLGRPRSTVILLSLFAALALVLAIVGVYGVLSYTVNLRAREVGIRMALGARRSEVLRLVVRQGMLPVLAGVLLGIVGTLGLERFLEHLLYGVEATDPVTLALAALTLTLAALAACLLPAHRAAHLDPATLLE